ncbi:type IV pilus assembly protein PilE [Thiohalospira halophila DSM 15071]|uniref:Type IV pilus assembly protein PilE n=1 Tax=Thiohalospira halophila DSM 15071 TaxID=1123397 RepID=A0A1I1QR09_9GAMM|nr:prepilin-type N-terminal cleavage/methylation domain-containing protein [Thiohalospira halophila]SFD24556.1 type IV pilus assembly protein PilE [Thiohalospira halophila DSM 15071]
MLRPGFTLVELMIVVAILGIVATVAIPTYSGYVDTARQGQARQNAASLELALESYYLQNNTYVAGSWDPDGTRTLETGALGWEPEGEEITHTYQVTAGDCGDIALCYDLTVTDEDGHTIIDQDDS